MAVVRGDSRLFWGQLCARLNQFCPILCPRFSCVKPHGQKSPSFRSSKLKKQQKHILTLVKVRSKAGLFTLAARSLCVAPLTCAVSISVGFYQISPDLLRAAYRWMQISSSGSTAISSPCKLFSACFYLLCLKLAFLVVFLSMLKNCTRTFCSHACVCVCVFTYVCVTRDISVCPAACCFPAEVQRRADRRDPLSRSHHASDGEGSLSPPPPAAYMGIMLQCM